MDLFNFFLNASFEVGSKIGQKLGWMLIANWPSLTIITAIIIVVMIFLKHYAGWRNVFIGWFDAISPK